MVDALDKKPPCQRDVVATEFAPLIAQLGNLAAAPLDAGLVTLVAKVNTPQFRRLHGGRR